MSPIFRRLLGAALFAVAGALAGGAWYAATVPTPLETNDFPKGTGVRLELSSNAEIRTVELYADQLTAKHSVATHGDGSQTNYWYRPDGTIEKAITESPADEHGKRTQRRYAEIAPDGFTFVYDVEYLADGRKTKETRLVDGRLQRSYFHDNGTARRVQVIAREKQGWMLTQEDIFRADATLSESLRNFDNSAWERKFFNEQGVLVASKEMAAYKSRYTEIAYHADGLTRARETVQNGEGTTVTLYRDNGTRDYQITWNGEVGTSSLMTVGYDADDRKAYQQWWSQGDGMYHLWLVKVYRADKTLARTIYFERGNLMATDIVWEGDGDYGGNYTRRRFGPDGLLFVEEDEVKNKVVATREFSPAQKITLDIPVEYKELRMVDPVPPQVIPYTPAMGP